MKKIFSLFLSLLLVLSLTACGSSTEATTEPTTEATTEATTEPTTEATTEATTEPTTEATTEATTEPTPETTEVVVDYNAIAAAIESTGTQWHYWNVDVIGEAFFINFAYNGMSEVVTMFKGAGYDENYSEWVTVKETVLALYESNVDLIKAFGVENPMCFLSLVNEKNHSEVFISVYNGEVTDDIMQSK